MARKKQKDDGYTFKPREYDREEKIALQKIVSNIPVTRKLLSQDLLVKATYNFAARNIRLGSTAARNVNTTKYPQLFFKSFKELYVTTENLVKIEPYWRFDGRTPTEQLNELNEKRDAIIKGFICDSFNQLVKQLESTRSSSKKQRLFDEYQSALMQNLDICGDENFEYFKKLCYEKLNITES